jgi:hypothetical protein
MSAKASHPYKGMPNVSETNAVMERDETFEKIRIRLMSSTIAGSICGGSEAPLQNEHENFALVTRALFFRSGVALWK